MIANFYPCRNRMSREIEQCTSLQNLERLLSFCSSCIYRIFEQAQGMDVVPITYSGEPNNRNNMLTAGMRDLADRERVFNIC